MQSLVILAQVIIAVGLLNVWLLRSGKATSWRGGDAKNMKEEFATYGLPPWFMMVVGSLKVSFALLLLAGIWVQPLAKVAAVGIAILMLGAVSMHVKVGDPVRKSFPALTLLVLSIFVAFM